MPHLTLCHCTIWTQRCNRLLLDCPASSCNYNCGHRWHVRAQTPTYKPDVLLCGHGAAVQLLVPCNSGTAEPPDLRQAASLTLQVI